MRALAIAALLLATACEVTSPDENDTNAAGNIESTAGVEPEPVAPAPQQPGAPAPEPSPPANEQEPSGDVTLRAGPVSTRAGATMTLILTNGLRQAVGYNLCTSTLQTSAGRPVATDRVCTMELRTLNPGAQARYSYELPGNLADGRYRFTTDVERMQSGGRETATSNAFTVD